MGSVSVKYRFNLFSILLRFNRYFGSSEFPTPARKFECLDTAEAGTVYKVEGEPKKIFEHCHMDNISSSSQVNLGGFGSFRRNSFGGTDNLPPSNR